MVRERAPLQNQLAGALPLAGRVGELPRPEGNQNFTLALQEELASTENKIAFARQYYNDAVKEYNIAIAVFPNNLISETGLRPRPLWAVDDASERNAVTFPSGRG